MKFIVPLIQYYYKTGTIIVDANSVDDANNKVENMIDKEELTENSDNITWNKPQKEELKLDELDTFYVPEGDALK